MPDNDPSPGGGVSTPASRPPGTVRIGRIAGADVLVGSSWFVMAALIALLVAPVVEAVQPGLGMWKYVAGLALAVVYYLSLLLHEASHAFMAQRYGHRVVSITLHFLGGMTSVDGEARSPRQEFVVAVVGPLTSIGVGAVAAGAYFVAPDGLLQVSMGALAGANLLLGVLNLLPGLPLDGGRVLKSLVWRITGSPHRGTIAAGWGGRVLALVLLAWPLVQGEVLGSPPELVDYVLVFVLALFLWSGATAAMTHARMRSRIPELAAAPLARRAVGLPEDVPLSEAVRRAQDAAAGSIVTLDPDGRPRGIVSESALLATPMERRPWMPVSAVARQLEEGLTLPAGIAGEALILAISRRPAEEYLLLAPDGSIHGVLSTHDVDRAFRGSAP